MYRIIFILLFTMPSFAKSTYNVEIEQNLLYYCMGKRKHPEFQRKSCKSYAYKTLYRCQREKKQSVNGILKCLKKSLKI